MSSTTIVVESLHSTEGAVYLRTPLCGHRGRLACSNESPPQCVFFKLPESMVHVLSGSAEVSLGL